tara:strand:+ start:285 stop:524 length:240 start_codon:yes stop_codon:yes gene_type:complete
VGVGIAVAITDNFAEDKGTGVLATEFEMIWSCRRGAFVSELLLFVNGGTSVVSDLSKSLPPPQAPVANKNIAIMAVKTE